MERWINPILMSCGSASGLLFGTGETAAGIILAAAGIAFAWALRTQQQCAPDT
ncbi:hypothetical protein [Pseudothauera rhizosphaerae]|uniref:hypothetical protein n=1 Tax=Pseudothauera rhizosphaerae TaxID=2565932 RepID=UPI001454D85B|nr:hypothetical protein [Pseudothauera rhizosphaerae]